MSDLESDFAKEADATDQRKERAARGTHYLKSWPGRFEEVRGGRKPFEIRKNDRDFRPGDHVVLLEWDPVVGRSREASGFTGRTVVGDIIAVHSRERVNETCPGALGEGYVVLAMAWRL